MTDSEKLSYLIDRPCTACKFHKEEGCSKWSCVFEDKSGDTEGEYIKIDDLDDTVLRLNNDGWEITRNEHKLISNVLYEMPLYSFPEEKGEEYRRGWHDAIGKALNEAYDIDVDGERFSVVQEETLLGLGMSVEPFPDREKGEWIPISERLPEIGQRVIVTYETFDEGLKVRETTYDKYGFLCGHGIAWQPLPKPYKAESEE